MKVIIFTVTTILCLLAIGMFAAQCLLHSGIEHARKGEFVEAAADFIMASRICPWEPKGAYFAGGTFMIHRNYDVAVKYYDRVRRSAPNYLQTNKYRNEALRLEGK